MVQVQVKNQGSTRYLKYLNCSLFCKFAVTSTGAACRERSNFRGSQLSLWHTGLLKLCSSEFTTPNLYFHEIKSYLSSQIMFAKLILYEAADIKWLWLERNRRQFIIVRWFVPTQNLQTSFTKHNCCQQQISKRFIKI